MSHNSTLVLYPGMIKAKSYSKLEPVGGGRRGKVKGFTDASRRRMIQKMHKITFDTMVFLTLTYPDRYPKDAIVYKRHLQAFRERMKRKYGKVRALWRLEFQKRGAPHYHLLLLDPPWIDRDWLSLAWYEIVGSGDERHLKAGTNLRTVARRDGNTGAVMAYITKYIGKAENGPVNRYGWTGRYWGAWYVREETPIEISVSIKDVPIVLVDAVGSRLHPSRWEPVDRYNWTIFGGDVGGCQYRRNVLKAIRERLGDKSA